MERRLFSAEGGETVIEVWNREEVHVDNDTQSEDLFLHSSASKYYESDAVLTGLD